MIRESDPATAVIVECELPEPREKVWKALTVPELLAKWLMPNDIRPEVGIRFHFELPSDVEAKRNSERESSPSRVAPAIECQVLEVEPNRRLRLSWREAGEGDSDSQGKAVQSIVTFELSETATGGTHLRLVHEGFEIVATNAVATGLVHLRYGMPRRPRRTRRRSVAFLNRPVCLRRAA